MRKKVKVAESVKKRGLRNHERPQGVTSFFLLTEGLTPCLNKGSILEIPKQI